MLALGNWITTPAPLVQHSRNDAPVSLPPVPAFHGVWLGEWVGATALKLKHVFC